MKGALIRRRRRCNEAVRRGREEGRKRGIEEAAYARAWAGLSGFVTCDYYYFFYLRYYTIYHFVERLTSESASIKDDSNSEVISIFFILT